MRRRQSLGRRLQRRMTDLLAWLLAKLKWHSLRTALLLTHGNIVDNSVQDARDCLTQLCPHSMLSGSNLSIRQWWISL